MKPRSLFAHLLVIILVLVFTSSAVPGQAQETGQEGTLESQAIGTVFTYQGQLKKDGSLINTSCDFQFTLYDAESGGSQVGLMQTKTGISLSNGLFAVNLDFGAGVFTGNPRWLAIAVKCPGDAEYIPLTDRQLLTPAPYALYAGSAGSVPWSGLASVPAGFADNVDNDTTYSAGTGLTLIDTVFTADTAYLQRRASGACAVGSTIRAINADGSLVCQTDAPLNRSLAPTGNIITTLDSTGDVGLYNSITIGSDGLGLIYYFDVTNGSLKVAHCEDLECTSATISTLDTGNVGNYGALTIGADGLGLISYMDDQDGDLKVAHCSNLACTAATLSTLDSGGWVGLRSSVTVGADGMGLISYYSNTSSALKVAHCSNPTCTSATISTLCNIGSGDAFYGQSSIVLGWDGLGLISFYTLGGVAGEDLKVAHCSDIPCTTATISTLDTSGSVGQANSITIGSDGLGLISYRDSTNGDLKVAHCDSITCATASVFLLDSNGNTGWFSSITIGADGLGVISYMGPAITPGTTDQLIVGHCIDIACTQVSITPPDTATIYSGQYSGITIGVDGLPLISYRDHGNEDLMVVHCASAACLSYFRRR